MAVQEQTLIMGIVQKIGYDKFEELCNVADVAILDDGLRIENRLTFVGNVMDAFPLTLEQLTEVFIYRLNMLNY